MPLKAAIPAIAAGISAAGGMAASAMGKQKPSDPYNPTTFSANETPAVAGGSQPSISPLQRNPMPDRGQAAQTLLAQGGF